MGMRGTGLWTANYLDYSNTSMVNEMWNAIPMKDLYWIHLPMRLKVIFDKRSKINAAQKICQSKGVWSLWILLGEFEMKLFPDRFLIIRDDISGTLEKNAIFASMLKWLRSSNTSKSHPPDYDRHPCGMSEELGSWWGWERSVGSLRQTLVTGYPLFGVRVGDVGTAPWMSHLCEREKKINIYICRSFQSPISAAAKFISLGIANLHLMWWVFMYITCMINMHIMLLIFLESGLDSNHWVTLISPVLVGFFPVVRTHLSRIRYDNKQFVHFSSDIPFISGKSICKASNRWKSYDCADRTHWGWKERAWECSSRLWSKS